MSDLIDLKTPLKTMTKMLLMSLFCLLCISHSLQSAQIRVTNADFEFQEKSPLKKPVELANYVLSLNLHHGLEHALWSKLIDVDAALNLDPPDLKTACQKLTAFLNQVASQTDRTIHPSDAELLIVRATEIFHDLGCPVPEEGNDGSYNS